MPHAITNSSVHSWRPFWSSSLLTYYSREESGRMGGRWGDRWGWEVREAGRYFETHCMSAPPLVKLWSWDCVRSCLLVSMFCHLLDMGIWVSYLTPPNASFLIYKVRILVGKYLTLFDCFRVKHHSKCFCMCKILRHKYMKLKKQFM